MRTLIGINNLTVIDQMAYANHIQFFYRLGKHYPKDEFILCNPRRMSIDKMRNFAAKAAMELECDYLMFIDDDVLIPINAFQLLQEADKDIISGITYIRGYPYPPMVFKWEYGDGFYYRDCLEHVDNNGLIQCDAVGFSCVLIKVSLLLKMRPPFFITAQNHTEDVYFCIRAIEQFPETTIYAHSLVQTEHILGSETIHTSNLQFRKNYDLEICPELKKQTSKSVDRGQEYLDSVLANEI